MNNMFLFAGLNVILYFTITRYFVLVCHGLLNFLLIIRIRYYGVFCAGDNNAMPKIGHMQAITCRTWQTTFISEN